MKLKLTLLSLILQNDPVPNKYSRSYLNLKNVMELEQNSDFKFHQEILDKYKIISDKYQNFLCNIPLIVIEQYYINNKENPNKFVFLEYKEKELTDLKVIEVFEYLENYFEDVFQLACLIADMYNLEVKMNKSQSSASTDFI